MAAAARLLVSLASVVLLVSCAAPPPPKPSRAVIFRHYENSIFQFTDNGVYTVEVVLMPDPPRVGENNATLLLHDFTARDIGAAAVTLRPVMPGTGHEPRIEPEMEDTGTGTYHIREIMLDRPGRWAYDIRIEKDGEVDRALVPLPPVQE